MLEVSQGTKKCYIRYSDHNKGLRFEVHNHGYVMEHRYDCMQRIYLNLQYISPLTPDQHIDALTGKLPTTLNIYNLPLRALLISDDGSFVQYNYSSMGFLLNKRKHSEKCNTNGIFYEHNHEAITQLWRAIKHKCDFDPTRIETRDDSTAADKLICYLPEIIYDEFISTTKIKVEEYNPYQLFSIRNDNDLDDYGLLVPPYVPALKKDISDEEMANSSFGHGGNN